MQGSNMPMVIISYVVMCAYMCLQYWRNFAKRHAWIVMAFLCGALIGTEYLPEVANRELVIGLLQVLLIILAGFLVNGSFDMRILVISFNAIVTVIPGNILGSFLDFTYGKLWLTLTGTVAMHLSFTLLIMSRIDMHYERLARDRSFPWAQVFLIPVFYYASVYTLMLFPSSMEQTPSNAVGLLFVSALMVVAYFLIIQILSYQSRSSQLKYNNEEYELLITKMRERMELIMNNQKQNAIVRHDMRHILQIVAQMIEREEYGEAAKVLSAHMQRLDQLTIHSFCQNIVINSVLELAAASCEENKIRFDVHADVPAFPPVSDVELGVVISNLLENAVNATKVCTPSEREVYFMARMKEEKMIIEISNTYAGHIEYDSKTHLPLSRKGEGHGLGMQSIQTFAKKYQALFDCTEEEGRFVVRLLL